MVVIMCRNLLMNN